MVLNAADINIHVVMQKMKISEILAATIAQAAVRGCSDVIINSILAAQQTAKAEEK